MCFIRRLHLRSVLITEIQQQQSATVKYCCHCCQSPTDSPTEKRLQFFTIPCIGLQGFLFLVCWPFVPHICFSFWLHFLCYMSSLLSSSLFLPLSTFHCWKQIIKKQDLNFVKADKIFGSLLLKKRKTHISHWNNLKLAKVINNKNVLKMN